VQQAATFNVYGRFDRPVAHCARGLPRPDWRR
jgi:hypothetical protein